MEQRVVRVLRLIGDPRPDREALDVELSQIKLSLATSQPFAQLTKFSLALSYRFQSAASPFVSLDELRLVGLIAQAQRINVDNRAPVDDAFRERLMACATVLDAVGLRLPSRAMVSTHLPDPAAAGAAPVSARRERGAARRLSPVPKRSGPAHRAEISD